MKPIKKWFARYTAISAEGREERERTWSFVLHFFFRGAHTLPLAQNSTEQPRGDLVHVCLCEFIQLPSRHGAIDNRRKDDA